MDQKSVFIVPWPVDMLGADTDELEKRVESRYRKMEVELISIY
jgi:deoxyadenosine/deoxycytidine kinase